MKKSHKRLSWMAASLVVILAAGQLAGQTSSPPQTVAPVGTFSTVSPPAPGQIFYIEERPREESLEIDAPLVSFTFEFSQSSPTQGVARVMMAPNLDLAGPELDVAIDGDLEVTLSDAFSRFPREKSAYKSVAPKQAFRTTGIRATTDNLVALDIPVTLSGARGVMSIGLRGGEGEGDAASLFFLREGGEIYVGVQGFLPLEEKALRDRLEREGADTEEIERQLRQLRNRPGDVEIKIQPPPEGREDPDPFNSITVNGLIQFTDINGATFPVQDADVEVYDVNGGAETLMSSGSTDSSGNYSITVAGVDTSGDGTGPDILVRVYPRGPLARVHQADGGDVYSMDSPVQNDVADDSTVTINITAGNDESTNPGQVAFEVYEANRYFGAFITSVNGTAPSQILVEYPRSAAGDGSSYSPGSNRMNLAISDGHDWDNIQHEYGHHVQNVFNLSNNPGGSHTLSQNSCVVRPTKDEGLRLAWGESWPTFYALIAQNEQNLAALGIPNLGDTSYTDTKPVGSDLVFDLETGTSGQTGEGTEAAIMRLFWDTYDNVDDGVDAGVSFSAQSLWDAATASNPEIVSVYWAQFIALFSEAQKFASGGTLTREGFGADLTNPASGTTYSGGAAPTFTWTPNLPCDSGGNGRYSVHFQHQGTGALLLATPFQSATSLTPSAAQLEQIFVAAGGNVLWSVLTRDLTAPQTGDYYSENRSVVDNFDVPDRDPVDIVLALDLSSSMNSPTPDGALPKIDVLQQAVELFINTWTVHSIADDHLGIVYFNSDVSSVAGTPPAPVLSDVAASAASFIVDVNSRSGSGCTAVGGALQEAFEQFDDPARPRFVLLFSDGMQNVNPFVGEDASGDLQIVDLPAGTTDFPFGGWFCTDTTASGLDGAAIAPDGELLADKDVTIHSIGVGVSGADFEDLIDRVSSETGGEHHFTSIPDAELDIFFTNDLVESLKQNTLQIVKTESGNLAPGSRHVIAVPVGPSAIELTLAISWKDQTATTPLAVTVTPPGASIPVMSNVLGQGHRVIHYDMPINPDGMNAQGAGEWRVELRSATQASLPYQFSALVDESCFKFDMVRPPGGLRAGDQVPIEVSLGIFNQPLLSSDSVQVRVSRPSANRGQLLANWLQGRKQTLGSAQLSLESLSRLRAVRPTGETTLLLENSPFVIHQLEAMAFMDPEFAAEARKRESFSVELSDRGSEGDRVAGDGIYSGLVPGATIPGNFQLELLYEGTNLCGPATRSEKSSFLVRLGAIDPDRSSIRITSVEPGVVDVSITPMDSFGNILGPGYGDQITIQYGGSQPVGNVTDGLDGSYTQRFSGVSGRPTVTAEVRGETVSFPPQVTAQPPRFALSLHAGVTQPLGDFNTVFDHGLLVEIDFEYRIRSRFSLTGVFGRYDFDPDYEIYGGTFYFRAYSSADGPRFYAEGGPGVYKPDFLDAALGLSLGAGVNFPLTPRLEGEVGVNYFHLFSQGQDIDFLGFKGGIRIPF